MMHRSYTILHINDSSKKVTTSKTNRRQIIIFNPLVKILRNVRDCTSAQSWWKTETSGQVAGTKQPHGVTKLFGGEMGFGCIWAGLHFGKARGVQLQAMHHKWDSIKFNSKLFQ